MKTCVFLSAIAMAISSPAWSQQAATTSDGFVAGTPLGVFEDGKITPTSSNVKVFGAIVNAESCSYDSTRGLIPNRGAEQKQLPNDGFVSLLNHDGSVHTARWIGTNRNGLASITLSEAISRAARSMSPTSTAIPRTGRRGPRCCGGSI